jgi:hypothetical protein
MPESDKYRRFEIIQTERHQEQGFYWTRFTGFATLHAGLFVIATSSTVQNRAWATLLLAVLGIVLSALWAEVQWLSLRYVDRWKPAYFAEARRLRFDIDAVKLNREWSSTDLGRYVPFAVLILWAFLVILAVLPPVTPTIAN